MTQELRCSSCGQLNDAGLEECANCSFPLHLSRTGPGPGEPVAPPAPKAPEPPAPAPVAAAPAAPPQPAQAFDPNIRRIRPVRPRPPRSPQEVLQVQLWLVLGGIAVLIVMYTAFKGFQQNNAPPPQQVEGANADMQHAATMARNELAKDSTNVNARVMLANILYDTANWSEAIIHYKAALRTNPDQVTTLVDLGVCYFNLGDTDDAVEQFKKGLQLHPEHPIALFNMGVVSESKEEYVQAVAFYNRALAAKGLPQGMGEQLEQAIKRANEKRMGMRPSGSGAGR